MARGDVHEVGSETGPRPGLQVSAWVFLFLGCFVGTLSLVYLLTDDDAGQMMLGVTSLFGLYLGAFFWLRWRSGSRPGHEAPATQPGSATTGQYLPHASVWPFLIGVATFLIANGLILGTWFLVPGGLLMLAALIGFGRQSRRRD